MAMSEKQKRIRRWFRDNGWSTAATPTNVGAWLEAPVFKGANYVSGAYSYGTPPKSDGRYYWHTEFLALFEIDRFGRDSLEINVYKNQVFTGGPDFEAKNKPWSNNPETSISLRRKELQKLLELMDACAQENDGGKR
jgi:hypothetical protein